MEILLAVIFIVLAVVLFMIEYIVETNKRKKLMSKKDWEEYMTRGLIIGQSGRTRVF